MNNLTRNNNGYNGMTTRRTSTPIYGLVDEVLNKALNGFFNDEAWGLQGHASPSQIPVNVRETDKTYELDLVAAGLKKEDFKVNIADNMLTISFEHQQENNSENTNGYLRQEYRMQSFSRSFALDDTIDAQNIGASYKDGILKLILPKKEHAHKVSKTIEIN